MLPALRRQRRVDLLEVKVILVYIEFQACSGYIMIPSLKTTNCCLWGSWVNGLWDLSRLFRILSGPIRNKRLHKKSYSLDMLQIIHEYKKIKNCRVGIYSPVDRVLAMYA